MRVGYLFTLMMRAAVLAAALSTGDVQGQAAPWLTLVDDPQISNSVCDVVNTTNAEMVILADPTAEGLRELVIVSGPDIILSDVVVDVDSGAVFLGDSRFGSILFQDDGDAFRTVWWVSDTGRAVTLDETSGSPIPVFSDIFPADFVDVPCDACDFWDDQALCASLDEEPTDPTDPTDPVPPTDLIDPDLVNELVATLLLSFCGAGSGTTIPFTFLALITFRQCRARRR